MSIPAQTWVKLITEIIALAFFLGIMWAKINKLEDKQEKHNNLVERMILVEYKAKLAEKDIEDLEEKHKEIKEDDD